MTVKSAIHPDEEQLLRAIVDEADLPEHVREHLAACATCSAERMHLEGSLARMAEAAERFAPLPERKVALPAEQVRSRGGLNWLPQWRWAMTAGMTAAAALVLSFGSLMYHSSQEKHLEVLYEEMAEDEQLMAEVGRLGEDPLPQLYDDISAGAEETGDEDVTGMRYPGRERHASSGVTDREGKRC